MPKAAPTIADWSAADKAWFTRVDDLDNEIRYILKLMHIWAWVIGVSGMALAMAVLNLFPHGVERFVLSLVLGGHMGMYISKSEQYTNEVKSQSMELWLEAYNRMRAKYSGDHDV